MVLRVPVRTSAFDAHQTEQSICGPLRDTILLHSDHSARGNLARFERLLLHDLHDLDQCEADRSLVVRYAFESGLR